MQLALKHLDIILMRSQKFFPLSPYFTSSTAAPTPFTFPQIPVVHRSSEITCTLSMLLIRVQL